MKYIILLLTLFFSFNSLYAEELNVDNPNPEELNINNTDADNYIEKIFDDVEFDKSVKILNNLTIDLSKIEVKLSEEYNSKIEFEWSLQGDVTKKGSIYEAKFEEFGNKYISLNIYFLEDGEKKLLINKIYTVFVYKNKSFFIIDNINILKEEIDLYIEKSMKEGIYIEQIVNTNEKELNQENILNNILNKTDLDTKEGNYIVIWGDKDFLFSIISKISKEIKDSYFEKKLNLVLVSPLNTEVFKKYSKNFISNKSWIDNILLLPETSMFQILSNSFNIINLEKELTIKEYEYINLNTNSKISDILFISKFINSLSNNGFGNNYIYIIILIPFLFTGISFFKHLVGLSPMGIIIPISLTILFFQIGLISTLIVLVTMIFINLGLGKITNKYTLLYTPKISFIIIINIVVIMFLLNILFSYNLINKNITDSLFIILFIVISERLITVILSKEFLEYKYNLLNTIIFAFVAYMFLSITIIQTLILAYPEIILFLIPINFIIGRFTGLRITEYFRFREVIKSMEEE